MSASFPSFIRNFTIKRNVTDDVLAEHVNDLQDEVRAIEGTLGANPQGSFDSVVNRLAALDVNSTVVNNVVSTTPTRLTSLETSVATLNSQMSSVASAYSNLSSTISSIINQLNSLSAQITSSAGGTSSLQNQIVALQNQLVTINQDVINAGNNVALEKLSVAYTNNPTFPGDSTLATVPYNVINLDTNGWLAARALAVGSTELPINVKGWYTITVSFDIGAHTMRTVPHYVECGIKLYNGTKLTSNQVIIPANTQKEVPLSATYIGALDASTNTSVYPYVTSNASGSLPVNSGSASLSLDRTL